MNKLKCFVMENRGFSRFLLSICNYINPRNKLGAKGVKLRSGVALLGGLKIISKGTDNEILLGDLVRIKDCTIVIHGSHNRIRIGDGAILHRIELCIEDDGNAICIGKKAELYGPSHLAAIEGTKILIGDNCLLSSDLHIRTGDSHSVLDLAGNRTNQSKDVEIGEHVWIGTRVTCLKGVYVPADCLVAATTTLCKQYLERNAVICGVPGEVVKTGVNWSHERI